jgi:hypothetical protein
MSRIRELQERRERLRLRSEELRAEFGKDEQVLEEYLSGFDRATAIGRQLLSPPVLIAGGALALTFLRPARVFGWVTRGLVLVSLARRALGFVQAFRSRTPPPLE